MPISELKSFKRGWFQVQDEAAQLVSLLLNPQPNETILDAGAGLGGKTGHIAQLMQNQGRIVAMDNEEEKLKRLDSEMERLGISIVSTRYQDLDSAVEKNLSNSFDRILLDAPCSGLGVLRRNPDIKWISSKRHLKPHTEKQIRFLENLAPLVRPAGVLVYAVCSIEPEENEQVLDFFLKKHPEFVKDNKCGILPQKIRDLIGSAKYFRTHSFLDQMDGFFFARLKRIK